MGEHKCRADDCLESAMVPSGWYCELHRWVCKVPGCDHPTNRKIGRFCVMHQTRLRRHGDINAVKQPSKTGNGIARRPKGERFWEKVNKTDLCWLWLAGVESGGYGAFWDSESGKTIGAHRVAYELSIGPIPPGLHLDHLCRNRSCVNPAHLEPVTPQENAIRGIGPMLTRARRLKECKRGHEFTPENTIAISGGRRRCRTCTEMLHRESRVRIAAKKASA